MKFVKISHEVARDVPTYAPFTTVLYNVAKGVSKDFLKEFYDILVNYGADVMDFIKNDRDTFVKSCAFQLQELSEQEIVDVYKTIPNGCYMYTKQEYLQKIQQIVDDYKSSLAKTQLYNLWKEKTGTAYPYDWSTKYQTPILSCVPISKWNEYKRAFNAANQKMLKTLMLSLR